MSLQLVVGAVASSGPVLAKLDFLEYLQVVQNSLAYAGGAKCVDQVRAAFTTVQGTPLTHLSAIRCEKISISCETGTR